MGIPGADGRGAHDVAVSRGGTQGRGIRHDVDDRVFPGEACGEAVHVGLVGGIPGLGGGAQPRDGGRGEAARAIPLHQGRGRGGTGGGGCLRHAGSHVGRSDAAHRGDHCGPLGARHVPEQGAREARRRPGHIARDVAGQGAGDVAGHVAGHVAREWACKSWRRRRASEGRRSQGGLGVQGRLRGGGHRLAGIRGIADIAQAQVAAGGARVGQVAEVAGGLEAARGARAEGCEVRGGQVAVHAAGGLGHADGGRAAATGDHRGRAGHPCDAAAAHLGPGRAVELVEARRGIGLVDQQACGGGGDGGALDGSHAWCEEALGGAGHVQGRAGVGGGGRAREGGPDPHRAGGVDGAAAVQREGAGPRRARGAGGTGRTRRAGQADGALCAHRTGRTRGTRRTGGPSGSRRARGPHQAHAGGGPGAGDLRAPQRVGGGVQVEVAVAARAHGGVGGAAQHGLAVQAVRTASSGCARGTRRAGGPREADGPLRARGSLRTRGTSCSRRTRVALDARDAAGHELGAVEGEHLARGGLRGGQIDGHALDLGDEGLVLGAGDIAAEGAHQLPGGARLEGRHQIHVWQHGRAADEQVQFQAREAQHIR